MRIKFLAIVLMVNCTVLSFAQGIEFFHGTWEEVKAKAKEADKLVFVDAYTTWCGPCKRMAANIFPLPEVGEFYNANFINYKLDMEKGEGPDFARKYGVRAYPTFVFVDGDGNMVFNRVGGSDAPGFIQMGKTAVDKFDKSPALAKKYEGGDRSPSLVLDYIKALNAAGKPSLKIANEYLANEKDTKSDLYYKIIFESALSSDSRPFSLLISNEKAIAKLVGKQAYDKRVYNALIHSVQKGIEYDTEDLITEAATTARKVLDKDNARAFPNHVDVLKADAANDGKLYISRVAELNKNLSSGTLIDLSGIIKTLQSKYSHLDNAQSILGVLYKKLADYSDDPDKRLDYAMYLSGTGDKSGALKEANKAKEDAQKKGIDTAKYDNTIIKINSK